VIELIFAYEFSVSTEESLNLQAVLYKAPGMADSIRFNDQTETVDIVHDANDVNFRTCL